MLIKVLFCTLVAVSMGINYSEDTCGLRPLIPSADQDRVVGGEEAVAGDWPWACSMLYNGRHICGGSIVSKRAIVTAAHCTAGSSASLITFDCGVHDRNNKEQWVVNYKTFNVSQHPQYDSRLIQNDISLIITSSDITPYSDYILPACWPQPTDTYEGKTSVATGWGTLFSGGSLSRYNMQVSMPVLTDSLCASRFSPYINAATQVCAGNSGEGKDTCQGDSGGPLVVRHSDGKWRVIGLTSWGYGCGDGGVYTRTSAFYSWANAIAGPLPTGL